LKKEWDSLKEHDIIFLVSFLPRMDGDKRPNGIMEIEDDN
jgi:hypothetical protein